jgi:hypothetical protein
MVIRLVIRLTDDIRTPYMQRDYCCFQAAAEICSRTRHRRWFHRFTGILWNYSEWPRLGNIALGGGKYAVGQMR